MLAGVMTLMGLEATAATAVPATVIAGAIGASSDKERRPWPLSRRRSSRVSTLNLLDFVHELARQGRLCMGVYLNKKGVIPCPEESSVLDANGPSGIDG